VLVSGLPFAADDAVPPGEDARPAVPPWSCLSLDARAALPPSQFHTAALLRCAVEMQSAIAAMPSPVPGKRLAVRIGLHTGDLVGGVIGTQTFRYDIFGKHVLAANAMEASGYPGAVLLSASALEAMRGVQRSRFAVPGLIFAERAEPVTCKGIGEMVAAFAQGVPGLGNVPPEVTKGAAPRAPPRAPTPAAEAPLHAPTPLTVKGGASPPRAPTPVVEAPLPRAPTPVLEAPLPRAPTPVEEAPPPHAPTPGEEASQHCALSPMEAALPRAPNLVAEAPPPFLEDVPPPRAPTPGE
jgi:hypothetical protein